MTSNIRKKRKRINRSNIPPDMRSKARKCPVCGSKALFTKPDGSESKCDNCNFRHVSLA
jgi:ssDNA-binding Zn-finger/Zn-ribbon topoisomerase 1